MTSENAADLFAGYFRYDPREESGQLCSTPPATWEALGRRTALDVFKLSAERVPAYRDFLEKQGVDATVVADYEDFQRVPLTDKRTYLLEYPLEAVCLGGSLSHMSMISASSGAAGRSLFWPRVPAQDINCARALELAFTQTFGIGTRSSLFVMCFALGTWVAGQMCLAGANLISMKGYRFNIVSPGLDVEEALRCVEHLSPNYDQVILAGYAPFIKDLVELGTGRGFDWQRYDVRFLFGGEGFSETWRDHLLEAAGVRDPLSSSVNLYASADASGIMGIETPLTISVRRLARENRKVREALFGRNDVPSLVQYVPPARFFESVSGELVLTAPGGVPLVRYNTHDSGGTLTFQELVTRLATLGADVTRTLEDAGEYIWKLPFAYIFGRSDVSGTLYGLNVYPEDIKPALESEELRGLVTGAFVAGPKYTRSQDQYLEIQVELGRGIEASRQLERLIRNSIHHTLKGENSEYCRLHDSLGSKIVPQIKLRKHGDSRFSSGKGKRRYAQ